MRFIEFYISQGNCCAYPAVIDIHIHELENAKGTLVLTGEGGEHLSLTPCFKSPIRSTQSETLSCPLGYSSLWGLALPLASSRRPSQLLCLLGLRPQCFQGTGEEIRKNQMCIAVVQQQYIGKVILVCCIKQHIKARGKRLQKLLLFSMRSVDMINIIS